jgi:hypothetical protein
VTLFALSELVVWARYVSGFDPGRPNGYVFGALLAAFGAALVFCILQQQQRARGYAPIRDQRSVA